MTSENDGVIMYVLYRKGDVMKILAYMVCAAVMMYSTICDFRSYKVSNVIPVTGWILALIVRFVEGGITGIIGWSQGTVVLFLIGTFVYLTGAIGGADVKMFSVIGAFLGVNVGITVVVISLMAGALIGVIKMTVEGTFISRIRHIAEYVKCCVMRGELIKYEAGYEGGGVIHFMLPIMIAVICVAGIV